MSREVRLTLAANAEGARTAALSVRGMLSGMSEADALACELAMAEAAANVASHARTAGVFTMVARTGNGRFSAAVCHRGPKTGPARAEMPTADAEGGRGLALITACMERVHHVHGNGESCVLMARRLSPHPAPRAKTITHPPTDQERP